MHPNHQTTCKMPFFCVSFGFTTFSHLLQVRSWFSTLASTIHQLMHRLHSLLQAVSSQVSTVLSPLTGSSSAFFLTIITLLLVTDQWSGSSSSAFSLASFLSFSISLIRTALAHAWLPLPWRASVVEKIYSSSQYNSNLKFEFKLCHLLHHYKVWFSSASFDLHIFLNQYLLMPSASVSLLREVLSSPPARHISSDISAFHVIRQCSRLERP